METLKSLMVLILTCFATPVQSQRTQTGADVIVVGAGISGLAAALEAARGGAKVLVIEMSSVGGGHAVVSGGNLCIVATPLQDSQGIKDSPDLAYQDFIRWGEDANADWVHYYVQNSRREIYDWLTEMGVVFFVVAAHEGNSQPRLHFPRGKGRALVTPIYRECLLNPRIEFLWNTQVKGLLAERNRIVGVSSENLRTGSARSFRADSIILATGGFQSNLEMVLEFWPKTLPLPKRVLTGAGHYAVATIHDAAVKAGAVLHNLDHQWNYALGLPDPRDPTGVRGLAAFNPASIWVNAQGKRFVNEFAGARTTLPALLAQEGGTYWCIFDEAGKKSFGVTLAGWDSVERIEAVIFGHPKLVKSAPTIEKLAKLVSLPPATLSETVERYNSMVERGTDTDFSRFGPRKQGSPAKISKAPFYAVQFFPITRKSMGGIKVDLSCRVLDKQRKPISGLYAVGEVTGFGGVNGKASLEGTFLGASIIMGRVAGRSVLTNFQSRKTEAVSKSPPSESPVSRNPAFASAQACAECHNLSEDVSAKRSGYWHYEQSHQIVLDRRLECVACHSELQPYDPKVHRMDRVHQLENCKVCHGS